MKSESTSRADTDFITSVFVMPDIIRQLLDTAWGKQALTWSVSKDSWPKRIANAICTNGQFRQHIIGNAWGNVQVARARIQTDDTVLSQQTDAELTHAFNTGRPNTRLLKTCYDSGYSVITNNLQERSSLIASLCMQMQQRFHCGVNCNAYLTPAQAQALERHYDDEDVIIMQLDGEKHWQVWLPGDADLMPLAGLPYSPHCAQHGAPAFEKRLQPGDCLYLPAGYAHSAKAEGQSSLHITFSLAALCMADLLIPLIRQRMLMQEPGRFLRQRIPLGWFDRNDEDAARSALSGLHSGFVMMAESLSEPELKTLFASLTYSDTAHTESSASCPT